MARRSTRAQVWFLTRALHSCVIASCYAGTIRASLKCLGVVRRGEETWKTFGLEWLVFEQAKMLRVFGIILEGRATSKWISGKCVEDETRGNSLGNGMLETETWEGELEESEPKELEKAL